MWMEIEVSRAGAELRLSARGSRGEQTAPILLGGRLEIMVMNRFAAAVRAAASRSLPLSSELLEQAQSIYRVVLSPPIDFLRARLAEASGGPIIVKLALPDLEIQAIPWEALCKPGESLGFWASSPDLLPVRGVTTSDPWQPRAVRGALRILAIAPTGGPGLSMLQSAIAERVYAGEIEWLDPLEGPSARPAAVFDRLRREPIPHVLHFVGHGGLDKGVPLLRLADSEDGDESWLPVELLAQQLKANMKSALRLIVLEACEGARPAMYASAAEILARAGADAVVAHLWPVKAEVARACSAALYRALAGEENSKGDIAVSMNEARRVVLGTFDASAEAFSPLLFLRGPDGVLFDFKGRTTFLPPAPTGAPKPRAPELHPALEKLVGKPFSLLLGDREYQRTTLAEFRDKLAKELGRSAAPIAPHLSMSVLAQRFALHRGAGKLGAEFQKAFRSGAPPPTFLEALARTIGPGVHTTLLRHPWLELVVADQQPSRTIYVFQPGDDGVISLCREAGSDDWRELDAPPEAIDMDRDIVLLRPYGGYTPEQVFSRPLLTEDDYAHGIGDLEKALPRELKDVILTTLSQRPVLLVCLSMHTSHHRMLLHRLYPRGILRGSVAVVDPEAAERPLWEKGSGLPGRSEGVEVIEAPVKDLAAVLLRAQGPET